MGLAELSRGALHQALPARSVRVCICVAPTEVRLAQARIQVTVGSRFARGTTFMNLDLTALLEEQHEKQQGRHPG
jgi:hypothetical protein